MARPSRHPVHPRDLLLSALSHAPSSVRPTELQRMLADHGIHGAPILYRALNELIAQGKVHKIQRTNSYIACNCVHPHAHALTVITVCQSCDRVEERHDHAVMHHLEALQAMGVPLIDNAVIELPIHCGQCA